VRRHRADDTLTKAIAKLIRCDLVIVDDVGMLPVSPDAAEALFRVVDAAYERRSLALTSNIHPSGFDELMPKSLAAATVDRLLHHAPHGAHRRDRELPPRPSDRREGGGAPGLTVRPAALAPPPCATRSAPRRGREPYVMGRTDGRQWRERWPRVGRSDGRSWGETDGR
jgi:IstB-like ATP binding protein